jgi:hypothetical protein
MPGTEIKPEELFFGAPVSLTVDGTEVGGTIDAPKVTITPTVYTPEFQNAKGPVLETDIITKLLVAAEFTVNQFVAEKIGWTMPGATEVAGTFRWTPGRIPSTAYHDVVLIGQGLDGREMVIGIENAVSVQPLELDMSNTAIMGMKVRLEGRYAAATPNVAPFFLRIHATGS